MMGVLVHYEPVKVNFIRAYPHFQEQFEKVGWLRLFRKFTGHEIKVTRVFS